MPETTCPLCAGTAITPAFPFDIEWNGKSFQYLECRGCQTSCLYPEPDAVDFSKMYAKSGYHDEGRPDLDHKRALASLQMAGPHLKGRSRVLDYGCGGGDFLRAAKDVGLAGIGVEFDPAVRLATERKTGVAVVGPDEIFARRHAFDIIHLGDVLEHIPRPAELIDKVERLLAPEGVLFIEGPLERNASLVFFTSVLLKTVRRNLGMDRPAQTPPYHLFLTNRSAQKGFFTGRLGFECVMFEVFENGYPYISAGPARWTPATAFKRLVGRSAIGLARLGFGGLLGNRFAAIFKPRKRS